MLPVVRRRAGHPPPPLLRYHPNPLALPPARLQPRQRRSRPATRPSTPPRPAVCQESSSRLAATGRPETTATRKNANADAQPVDAKVAIIDGSANAKLITALNIPTVKLESTVNPQRMSSSTMLSSLRPATMSQSDVVVTGASREELAAFVRLAKQGLGLVDAGRPELRPEFEFALRLLHRGVAALPVHLRLLESLLLQRSKLVDLRFALGVEANPQVSAR